MSTNEAPCSCGWPARTDTLCPAHRAWMEHLQEEIAEEGWPHRPCEDAPCCGHGGICGKAIGMSMESYESGFDDRSDDEIKESIYAMDPDDFERGDW